MPKEQVKAFRKGTKSCTECRQRKLRCIPPDDDSKPCQNCAARGRQCVLQVNVGRTSEPINTTSRDRISHLENSVSQLWRIVGQLRNDLGHDPNDTLTNDHFSAAGNSSDPEGDDASPLNPPAHLQQLFDNEFVDTQTPDGLESTLSSDHVSSSTVSKARSRLQALIPSREDVHAICDISMKSWMSIYSSLFPTIHKFNTGEDIIRQYDYLTSANANPITVAGFLVSVAITLAQRPAESLPPLDSVLPNPAQWIKNVNHIVEDCVVKQDDLACTFDGVETSLLFVRLQLIRVQPRRLWILLRRVISLAELIGLPRAAQRANVVSPASDGTNSRGPKHDSPAKLWKSICSIDRLVGTMFNLPFGTAPYGFPTPETVMADGEVQPPEFFSFIAVIAGKVQEIDEAYVSRKPEEELVGMAFRAEQQLRTLKNMVPPDWWNLTDESPLPHHVLQYWYNYYTIRAHIQLALRQRTDSQHEFSHIACYRASRELAQRYIKLRSLLPAAFFAGRVLDLQAMTGAVVLLFTSQRQTMPAESGPPSKELVEGMIRTMDSISNQASGNFAKQAAPSLRALTELMYDPRQADAKNLTLHLPMLGKISVSRHAAAPLATIGSQLPNWDASQPTVYAPLQQRQQQQEGYNAATAAVPVKPNPATDIADHNFANWMPWSMDLMMDDFVPGFPEDPFGVDQYMSFDTFNGQV